MLYTSFVNIWRIKATKLYHSMQYSAFIAHMDKLRNDFRAIGYPERGQVDAFRHQMLGMVEIAEVVGIILEQEAFDLKCWINAKII